MARQDIAELGLDDEEAASITAGAEGDKKNDGGTKVDKQQQQPRTKEGFVAGLRPSNSKK